jgi:hypothetical protein
MSYSDGNTPAMGDKVRRQKDGKVGTVYHVQLNYPVNPGHDNIGFKPDDGSISIGNSLAVEYVLISRSKEGNKDEDGHDLAWHKSECPKCIHLSGTAWDWCQKAIPLVAREPL